MSTTDDRVHDLYWSALKAGGALATLLGLALFVFAGLFSSLVFVGTASIGGLAFHLQVRSSRRQVGLTPRGAARSAATASLGRTALRGAALAAACSLDPSSLPWATVGLFVVPASVALLGISGGAQG